MPNMADTNEGTIARLDAALSRRGETAVLKRRIDETKNYVELAVRVRLTGYAVDNLVAGIKVTDSKFIMSPSPIYAVDNSVWPGAAGGGRWPVIGDFLFVGGKLRKIEQILPMSTNGVVRIEGRVS